MNPKRKNNVLAENDIAKMLAIEEIVLVQREMDKHLYD
jgi:hypothetical protein